MTNGVRVLAAAEYTARESDPERPLHMFVYRVRLTNESDRVVRLESRHWVIVDGNGERRDVHGPGVVSEYPMLEPGQSFQYESRCPLTTAWGTMEGNYRFVDLSFPEPRPFDVAVGRFFLAPSVPSIIEQLEIDEDLATDGLGGGDLPAGGLERDRVDD
ncbi:MAG: Co2+/Mg2+ efflux protein ApaG [Planctomycetota bacterium]